MAGLLEVAFDVVDAELAQALGEVRHHGVDLVFHHHRRVVQFGLFQRGVQHFVDVGVLGVLLGLFTQGVADAGDQVVQCLVVGADQLGEFVVEFGLFVGLNVVELHMECGRLARVDALAVFRPAQLEVLLLARRHTQQRLVKTGRLHGILLVGRHIPVGLIQHDGLFAALFTCRNDALDVDVEQIAVLAGALHILPAGVFLAVGIEPRVDGLFADLRAVFVHAQGAVVAQLDDRLQRHEERVDHGIERHVHQRTLRVGIDLFLLNRIAIDRLAQILDDFIVERALTQVLGDDVVGRFALAETGDAVVARQLARGTLELFVHTRLVNFHHDLKLAIFLRFGGNFQ